MPRIQRALLSVYDKTGLIPFAEGLARAGVELISTGGTAQALRAANLSVKDLSAHTGFPEMLDGRVKTLHPKVHGGLLFIRGSEEHEAAVRHHGIEPIDLVVVNLYPFEKTVAKAGVTLDEAIENIDIGGPSMLRSAAKNAVSVTVIVDPEDYEIVLAQVSQNGETTLALRRTLAAKVFRRTSAYDHAIAFYLNQVELKPVREGGLPDILEVRARQSQTLRYGENPHQQAALYGGFADYFEQLHGKELSYNNILDATAAAQLISEFDEVPTLAILKHTNPCGVGQGTSLTEAWSKAYATDKQAPFGGIIVCNKELDSTCAQGIAEIFSEVIIAPSFSASALDVLTRKKNLRLLRVKKGSPPEAPDVRSVGFESFLVQTRDIKKVSEADLTIVTRRPPTENELRAMLFGWKVVKHIKSNAITFVKEDRTLGIGAGQMSRVDSSRIAVWKANEAGLSLKGSVICSDAFFPFADGLIAAAEAGATAAIQPGGSVRDAEVIAAANERGLTMAFTNIRHFRH